MVSDVPKFVVQRSKWLRGTKKFTKILNDKGERDCIGFLLRACGFADDQIMGLDEPIDVVRKHGWNTRLITWSGNGFYQNAYCDTIIRTNDCTDMTNVEREQTLKDLFKMVDIEVEFVD